MKRNFTILFFLLAILTSCDKLPSKSHGHNRKNDIVGTWRPMKSSDSWYYFTSDGKMTAEKTTKSEGQYHVDYDYTISNDILHTVSSSGYKSDYKLSISGDTLSLESKYQSIKKYLLVDSSEPHKYEVLPYDVYLCYDNTYFPLAWAQMRTYHSTVGSTEGNFKSLIIGYSHSSDLKPTYITFSYFTPYYDGITLEWSDGTYKIHSDCGNYYQYGVTQCYAGNNNLSSGHYYIQGGKLTIKTSNKIKTIDYKDESGLKVHFVGQVI